VTGTKMDTILCDEGKHFVNRFPLVGIGFCFTDFDVLLANHRFKRMLYDTLDRFAAPGARCGNQLFGVSCELDVH